MMWTVIGIAVFLVAIAFAAGVYAVAMAEIKSSDRDQ